MRYLNPEVKSLFGSVIRRLLVLLLCLTLILEPTKTYAETDTNCKEQRLILTLLSPNSVGQDLITFHIDNSGEVKVIAYQHLKNYEFPPHWRKVVIPTGSIQTDVSL